MAERNNTPPTGRPSLFVYTISRCAISKYTCRMLDVYIGQIETQEMARDNEYQKVGIYSTLRQVNKLIWKLHWLILCPVEIIGIICRKCITFTVCFKNIFICLLIK
jgi:hypothetical protein